MPTAGAGDVSNKMKHAKRATSVSVPGGNGGPMRGLIGEEPGRWAVEARPLVNPTPTAEDPVSNRWSA